jgi:hypothetical protein
VIQLTYGEAKAEIARVCGVSGMSVTDPRVLVRTNTAIQELMNEGEFPNVVDRWHIVSTDGKIVLPSFLDRLMQINIKGVPQVISSPWYQFCAYGPGTPQDNPQAEFNRWWVDERMITDEGEFPVQTALPETGGPWKFRVYTSVDETYFTNGTAHTPVCTIQGTDGSGQIVRMVDGSGTWSNGETVALNHLLPYVETTTSFSTISAFTKPVTNGHIRLTAWNGVTETTLANYVYSDTTPSYHHYFSQWLQTLTRFDSGVNKIVRARCRKRFVPVAEDTDVLIVSNLEAIKEMVIAQWKRTADNLQSYMAHKQTAINLMNKEAEAYRGKSRIPGLTFQRGFAIGSNIAPLR